MSDLQNTLTLIECMESPHAFLQHIHILDPNLGDIKFVPWDWQPGLINTWHTNFLSIVLKARQLGVSWLVAGYALWTVLYHEGANALMLSMGEKESKKLLSKAKYIYTMLPDFLKPTCTRDNDSMMQFGSLHSEISALPATEDAGRSEAATLVVVDESASHPYAEANYSAYKPTIDAGGKLIHISTAKGRGNLFHRLWNDSPGNRFTRVFLNWRLRPGRDDNWYQEKVEEYSATPTLLKQEYPNTPEEAFIANSYCVFDTERISQELDNCRPPIETRDHNRIKIWQHPIIGRKYVAGADVAEGKDSGNDSLDYSGAAIYDFQTLVHVADLHGQWPLDLYAKHLHDLCHEYGDAYLGIERNNHGHAVISKLRDLRYSNLYFHQDRRPGSRVSKAAGFGWPTNIQTRPDMETDLAAAITSNSLISYDREFWDECISYVHQGNGKAGADAGCHDDRVIKHMIAVQVRRRYRPQQNKIRQYNFAVVAG